MHHVCLFHRFDLSYHKLRPFLNITGKSSKPSTPAPKAAPVDPNKPVQMYISPDVRPNSPPTTIDGKYVADHLGNALTMALAEISERRPWDPIEYLANWLYKYQENTNYNKRVKTVVFDCSTDFIEIKSSSLVRNTFNK